MSSTKSSDCGLTTLSLEHFHQSMLFPFYAISQNVGHLGRASLEKSGNAKEISTSGWSTVLVVASKKTVGMAASWSVSLIIKSNTS